MSCFPYEHVCPEPVLAGASFIVFHKGIQRWNLEKEKAAGHFSPERHFIVAIPLVEMGLGERLELQAELGAVAGQRLRGRPGR